MDTPTRRNPMNAALTVSMTEDMRMAIEAETGAENVNAAAVDREAVADALPRIKERRRKRAGRQGECRPDCSGGVSGLGSGLQRNRAVATLAAPSCAPSGTALDARAIGRGPGAYDRMPSR